MRLLAGLCPLLAVQVRIAWANTEKVIFVSPSSISLPDAAAGPALEHLGLDRLSPAHPVSNQSLAVAFPTLAAAHGRESWYLIQHLHENTRYEVRICWPAIVRLIFDVRFLMLTPVT
jgi:hypothetical protein